MSTPSPAPGSPSVEQLQVLLPQLEIFNVLGAGGMGSVYLARQPALDRLVAVKIVMPREDPNNQFQFAERFQREAQAMAKMHHPRIIAIHDFGQTLVCQSTGVSFLYIVMEYVDGTTLEDIIHSQRLAKEQILAIITQVCDALQYAHERGIVHRDIKPSNIMVDREGQVKVADFGLAKLVENSGLPNLTSTNIAMGTLNYAAPEVLTGETDYRVDIYALGVVLYESLTGEVPRGAFRMPSEVVGTDLRLDEVVEKALQPDPEDRYSTVTEFWKDLDSVITGPPPSRVLLKFPEAEQNPSSKTPSGKKARGSRKSHRNSGHRKNPLSNIGIVVVACIVVIGVIGHLLKDKKAGEGINEGGDSDMVSTPASPGPSEDSPPDHSAKAGTSIGPVSSSASLPPVPIVAPVPASGTVRVYIIAGQTNAAGSGSGAHLRDLIGDANTSPKYAHLAKEGEDMIRDNVWVRQLQVTGSGKLPVVEGPLRLGYGANRKQFGIELQMGHILGDYWKDPVLILKYASGPSSLGVQFRSPSAGPADYPIPSSDQTYGSSYQELLAFVHESLADTSVYFEGKAPKDYKMEGFVWFQGFNDQIRDFLRKDYAVNLSHFIRDIRSDLAAPALPFVITEFGLGKGNKKGDDFRQQQREVSTSPEFNGNVTLVETQDLVREEGETFAPNFLYSGRAETFVDIGNAVGEALLSYASQDPPSSVPPATDPPGSTLSGKGQLRIWGVDNNHFDLDVGSAAAIRDFTQVQMSARGWWALRENGDLHGSSEGGARIASDVQYFSPARMKSGLGYINKQGQLNQSSIAPAKRSNVKQYESSYSHQVVLYQDGSILPLGYGEEDPLVPFPRGATSIVKIALAREVCAGLNEAGELQLWGVERSGKFFESIQEDLKRIRFADIRGNSSLNTFAGLTKTGDMIVFGPEGYEAANNKAQSLHDVRKVRINTGIVAAQLATGSWSAWGSDGNAVVEKVNSFGAEVVDISFTNRGVVWIEAAQSD